MALLGGGGVLDRTLLLVKLKQCLILRRLHIKVVLL